MVDTANATLQSALTYYLEGLSKFAGGNFIVNETQENAGNQEIPFGPNTSFGYFTGFAYQIGEKIYGLLTAAGGSYKWPDGAFPCCSKGY